MMGRRGDFKAREEAEGEVDHLEVLGAGDGREGVGATVDVEDLLSELMEESSAKEVHPSKDVFQDLVLSIEGCNWDSVVFDMLSKACRSSDEVEVTVADGNLSCSRCWWLEVKGIQWKLQ
ncbi:hypothetical protein NE237_030035 [Protea cynaroides]|uniref:Uncharacterized protein n=1 Tax=Protea cynaroides TaxID=273540 RepID=A0A9Q0GSY1_9MAGN|nr:hypothetical protein NE237_030035 [Protea cynaroides]